MYGERSDLNLEVIQDKKFSLFFPSTHVSAEMFKFSKHVVEPGFGRFTSCELRAKFLNNFDERIDLY